MSRINENLIFTIGQKFRERREELSFTQKDVAYMTDLTINTIAAVEKGKGATMFNFLLICRALKMQPRTLFEDDLLLIPLNFLEPDSKRRKDITQRLDELVYNSNFFDTPKRVSHVITELESEKNESNKFSVYLTAYCKEGILEFQKIGNFKLYKKKNKKK